MNLLVAVLIVLSMLRGRNDINSSSMKNEFKMKDGYTEYGPTDFKRYRLDCWIKWKDYLQTPANRWSNRVEKERKLSTVMAVFDLE